ncbi:chemotaxis-specific protein-glutamate methyltransferase CheB [Geminocystis sp. GBBB08]|uniref:chemotaxis-specific protein-glutamate methyltransferase CheB n=1 Tax=Geminocystis sp. GBBB08 TaxID=2604140 RepID=UPI0027E38A49|nr:chemotaxis-specific protein-glutamate methyltransferase CheB [Geminocystis sp. GBBB08]MBL1208351.1 chemotaxis-specific protein-glutamate methyltransferase CheB [Geminocystis sp. GBBB08]
MTIKVLLVEDSPVATILLQKIINASSDIQVVGTAKNGLEGLELLKKLNPDVICSDLHMPKMNGLEFTKEVMANFPKPILVISASVQEEDTKHVFDVLNAGAVDIFPKPRSGQPKDYDFITESLLTKIRVLSGIKVFRRKSSSTSILPIPSSSTSQSTPVKSTPSTISSHKKIQMIAIGTSTGGPQVLLEILGKIPAHFSVPIVCVQHISEGFLDGLIDWLNNNCQLKVKVAMTGEKPQGGYIYFPREKHHLEFDRNGRFFCFTGLPVDGHCPSVTVTFNSCAKVFGKNAIGVLLTGMGKDGAQGLLAMSQQGAYTIAQDEASSVVFGMPGEAIRLGGAKKVLPDHAIASHLMTLTR